MRQVRTSVYLHVWEVIIFSDFFTLTMSKCRIDGCNRSKELSPDGYCAICMRAAADQRAAGTITSNSDSRHAPTPPMSIDFSKFDQMAQQLNSGEVIDQTELLKGVFGMVYNVAKSVSVIDQVKSDIRSNTNRIEAIENRLGGQDEIPLHLGLVILNLPLPPTGVSELEYSRAVIKEVNAPGVICQTDVVKAVRIGFKEETSAGAGDGKLGRVEVEIANTDSKASIMKTKRVLDRHPNEILRKLRIFNKKTQEQQNQDFTNRQLLKMIPGGEAWYIAGNGQLKPQQNRFQHPGNFHHSVNQFQSQFNRPPPQPRLHVQQPGAHYQQSQQFQYPPPHPYQVHTGQSQHFQQQQAPQYQLPPDGMQQQQGSISFPPTSGQSITASQAQPQPHSNQSVPVFSFANPPHPVNNPTQHSQQEQPMAQTGGGQAHGQE